MAAAAASGAGVAPVTALPVGRDPGAGGGGVGLSPIPAPAAAADLAPTCRMTRDDGLEVEAAALQTAGRNGRPPPRGDAGSGSGEEADGNAHRVVVLIDGTAGEGLAFRLRASGGRPVRRVTLSVADKEVLTGVEVGEVGAPPEDPDGWAEVVEGFSCDGLLGTTTYTLGVQVGAADDASDGNDGDGDYEDDREATTLTVTRYYTAAGMAVYTRPADGGAATVLTGSGRDGLLVGD